MVDLVRYNRRISPELPNISVNRVSSADAENMFGGAAAAVDAFLSAGEQDRIRKNIADAENIARDVQLGTTVIRDANGKEVTKYQTPEMFAGGSRSEQAYNDIVRQRYQNASIEKIRQDVRQMETSNFRDPEGYQAAISAYSDALQLPPTGLLGTELTKAAALSAESIKRRKEEMLFQMERDNYVQNEYLSALIDPPDDFDEKAFIAKGQTVFGLKTSEFKAVKNSVERNQIDSALRGRTQNMTYDEQIKFINELSSRSDLAEIFMTDVSIVKQAIATLKNRASETNSLENIARTNELNGIYTDALEAGMNASIAADMKNDDPRASVVINETINGFNATLAKLRGQAGTVNPENRAALLRVINHLTSQRRSLREKQSDIGASSYLAAMMSYVVQSDLASTPGQESLSDVIEALEGASTIVGRSSDLEISDQSRLVQLKNQIESDYQRLLTQSKDVNTAYLVATRGAEEPSNTKSGRAMAENVFSLFDRAMTNLPYVDGTENPEISEEIRLTLLAGNLGGYDLTDEEIALVPEELGKRPVYTPRMAAAIMNRTLSVPTSLNSYLERKINSPLTMTAEDSLYIYQLVNAMKSSQTRNVSQLGFPSGIDDYVDGLAFEIRVQEGDFAKAFRSYSAVLMKENEIVPGAEWKRYTQDGKSVDAQLDNIDGWGVMSANQQARIAANVKSISNRKTFKSAVNDAAKIFHSEHAPSVFNFDVGADQTKEEGYALFPLEWIVNGYERAGIDLEEEDYIPKIQEQIDELDQKGQDGKPLELGKNVRLTYEASSPVDKYTGTYRLVLVTFGEDNDSLPNPELVFENGLPASIDVMSIMAEAAKKGAEDNRGATLKTIQRLRRIKRANYDTERYRKKQPAIRLQRFGKKLREQDLRQQGVPN